MTVPIIITDKQQPVFPCWLWRNSVRPHWQRFGCAPPAEWLQDYTHWLPDQDRTPEPVSGMTNDPTKSETPTPRVNDAIHRLWKGGYWSDEFANFARTLEREHDALEARVKELEKETLDYYWLISPDSHHYTHGRNFDDILPSEVREQRLKQSP